MVISQFLYKYHNFFLYVPNTTTKLRDFDFFWTEYVTFMLTAFNKLYICLNYLLSIITSLFKLIILKDNALKQQQNNMAVL